MALIECKNCGNKISDKATVCPSCGNSVQTENKIGIDLFFVLSLIGGILLTISPFLPYVKNEVSILEQNLTTYQNMFEVSKATENKNWTIISIIILALGLILIVLTVLTIWKNTPLLTIIFSGIALVVVIIFDFSFRQHLISEDNGFAEIGFDNPLSHTMKIGFYTMILGPVICVISNIIKSKVKR